MSKKPQPKMRPLPALLVALVSAILLAAAFAPHRVDGRPPAVGPQTTAYPSACDRLGMGVAPNIGQADEYDVARLGGGWYIDWGTRIHPAHPAGMEHLQLIYTREDTFLQDKATIAAAAIANPGVTWAIGNEPECAWQGNSTPDQYARLYHQLYTWIKMHDPSARVTVGGFVQVTPLRLQWLDAVLARYQALYGEPLPVDLWNIHTFVLREEKGSWGCEIPAGLDATQGMMWEIQDHDRLDLIQAQVVRFRRWMRDHGERDKELIISEYGVLMPDKVGYDFDAARVEIFMLRTFDYFMTATDPELGYPADGNRLVQRWAWYSLNDPLFEGFPSRSHFFEPDTKRITSLGRAFSSYTLSLGCPSYVDLVPVTLSVDRPSPLALGGQSTVTLTATVRNAGNTDVRDVSVQFWATSPSQPIAPAQTIPALPARSLSTVSVQWTPVSVGKHTIGVTVDPQYLIAESDETNNRLSRSWVVGPYGICVPLIPQSGPVDLGF